MGKSRSSGEIMARPNAAPRMSAPVKLAYESDCADKIRIREVLTREVDAD